MKRLVITFAFLIPFLTSCDLFDDEVSLKIEVFNLDNWSPENPFPDAGSGVAVKLYESLTSDQDLPIKEAVTDANSMVKFNVPDGNYWIRIDKGTASNLVQKELVDDLTMGLIIVGYYHSQEEVDSEGIGGYVGGPVFQDQNGDRAFDSNDKMPGSSVSTGENNRVFIMSE